MKQRLKYNDVKVFIENNNEYELLSKEYVNVKTKLEILHKTCNKKFEMTYDHFKRGQRCPNCFGKRLKTTQIYKDEVYSKFGQEFEILDEYINSRTPIKTKHICGHIWYIRPDNLLSGYGCPVCGGSKSLNTTTFKKRVYDIFGEEYKVLSEYVNKTSKIKILHTKCNHVYDVIAGNLIYNKTRCPECSKNSTESSGEQKIAAWLENKDIPFKREYTFDDCVYKRKLRFDFAINDLNNDLILIEYDGEQHFVASGHRFKNHDLELIKKRDAIKNKYCKDNGITLLRISYKDYNNIEEILSKTFNDYPKVD